MAEFACSVVEVSATCATCGATEVAVLAEADFERYCAGALVQEAFPEATPAQREVVIGWRSGYFMCSACWEAMGDE